MVFGGFHVSAPAKLHVQHKSPWSGNKLCNLGEGMAAPTKYLCVVRFLVVLGIVGFNTANGAGECGRTSPDMEAMKLIPCAEPASDPNASVSRSCCQQIQKLGKDPKCLCAVMLSDTAKSSGAKPEVAITIPKRCNLANRPVGYKCGPYTLP